MANKEPKFAPGKYVTLKPRNDNYYGVNWYSKNEFQNGVENNDTYQIIHNFCGQLDLRNSRTGALLKSINWKMVDLLNDNHLTSPELRLRRRETNINQMKENLVSLENHLVETQRKINSLKEKISFMEQFQNLSDYDEATFKSWKLIKMFRQKETLTDDELLTAVSEIVKSIK